MKKKILLSSIIIIIICIFVVCIMIFGSGKPRKYKSYAISVGEAFADEKKMNKVIKDKIIDLRAAVAWKEADFDPANFDEAYKDVEKDDERIEQLEEALKEYAELSDNDKIKVSSIKKPKQSSVNKKIWTVQAKWTDDEGYSEPVTYVFYKGKIIDVNGNEDLDYIDSFFAMVIDYADLDENPTNMEKNNTEIVFKVDNKFINRYGYITNYENYSVISVEGLKIESNQEKIEEATFSKISNLISDLKESGLIGKTTKIDVTDMNDVVIEMKYEKKNVRFGKFENIRKKCELISKMLEVEQGVEGVIFVNVDLDKGEKPYFRESV